MRSSQLFPMGRESKGVHLCVFPTKAEMLQELARWDVDADPLTDAMCLGFGGSDDICASMFFYEGDLSLDIVAHECWHATLRWLDSEGYVAVDTSSGEDLVPQDSAEERGAYFHGSLMQLVAQELKRFREEEAPDARVEV